MFQYVKCSSLVFGIISLYTSRDTFKRGILMSSTKLSAGDKFPDMVVKKNRWRRR